jgi:hypothetical protein
MEATQHIMGDRSRDPLVPFYAATDPTIHSDPQIAFLTALDDDVRMHRERCDGLKASWDRQAAISDPQAGSAWETYTAQCGCLANALERRENAWKRREQTKLARRRGGVTAILTLIACGILAVCWLSGSRGFVLAVLAFAVVCAAFTLLGRFAAHCSNDFADRVAQRTAERLSPHR